MEKKLQNQKSSKKRAHAQIKIDWDLVDSFLEAGSSGKEVSECLGICHKTLYRRCLEQKNMLFVDYASQKKSKGKALIRRKQYTEALNGNTAMLKLVGEYLLNQRPNNLDKLLEQKKQKEEDLLKAVQELNA